MTYLHYNLNCEDKQDEMHIIEKMLRSMQKVNSAFIWVTFWNLYVTVLHQNNTKLVVPSQYHHCTDQLHVITCLSLEDIQ